jgi:hypothetical protein
VLRKALVVLSLEERMRRERRHGDLVDFSGNLRDFR